VATKLKKGDKVEWTTSQGPTSGSVEKTLTKPMDIKGHHVAASPSNPEVLVKSAKSSKLAAHKPRSLKKVA
jgi:Hypervirulence associated proteins TUDOR domain